MSAETWSRGDWMQTYTGVRFHPLDPRPEDIDAADIAHALSLICRYGGHVHRFYSVAEHCVLMSQAVPSSFALWALLHDAAEAYVGDMVRPLKRSMAAYQEVEEVVMSAIAQRFALPTEWKTLHTGRWVGTTFTPHRVPVMPPAVKDADNRILLTERDTLMPNTRHAWTQDGMEPLPVTVTGWSPEEAERRYLDRLAELGATR